jgi:hypothetical protein
MTDKAIEAGALDKIKAGLEEVLVMTKFNAALAEAKEAVAEERRADLATAQARIERLEAALREARSHFIVEYSDGKIVSTGHHSEALPKIVAILDAALKGETP